jgi:hypothetical protein
LVKREAPPVELSPGDHSPGLPGSYPVRLVTIQAARKARRRRRAGTVIEPERLTPFGLFVLDRSRPFGMSQMQARKSDRASTR